MAVAILDCYTDEPSGLGVPPMLGVYPRYLYGKLWEEGERDIYYLTIDEKQHDESYKTIYSSSIMKLDKGILREDIVIPNLAVAAPSTPSAALPPNITI